MASTLLKVHIRPGRCKTLQTPSSPPLETSLSFLQIPSHQPRPHVTFLFSPLEKLPRKRHAHTLLRVQASVSSPNPPTSKQEAINQAKTCLSTTLEKPLNNSKLTSGKLKKLKQARFRVEIPLVDDSAESLSRLVSDVFQGLRIKRRGYPVKIVLLWPDKESSSKAFESTSSSQVVVHTDLTSVAEDDGVTIFNSADVLVFLAPEPSKLNFLKELTERVYPKPVVIFNPKWAFEEEDDLGELSTFVGSFEVIYSFMGLEVKGILSKRKGVIFKCVRDGVVSGERWAVLVEEGGGSLKVVSSFKSRPSIGEVETVLYNLMAMNSPITKSARFLRDLVSNVTGKK